MGDKSHWRKIDQTLCTFLTSKKIIEKYSLTKICSIYFSPSFNDYSIKTLAEKIINDQLEVTLQNQFHKQIWGEIRGK